MNKKDFFCNSFHIIYTNMSNEVVIFFFGVLIINIGYQLMTRKDKKMEWKERPHRNENVNDDAERQDNDKQGRPGRHSPGKCTTQKYIWNRQIQIYTPYLIAACTSSEKRIIQTEKEVTLSSGVDTGNLVPWTQFVFQDNFFSFFFS